MSERRYRVNIFLEDLKEAQAIAILGMLRIVESDSRKGHSEYVGFYVDGDGDFHPKTKITTDCPIDEESLNELTRVAIKKHTHQCTLLDYDPIAWKLGYDRGEWR